jgi:hypothetical protein
LAGVINKVAQLLRQLAVALARFMRGYLNCNGQKMLVVTIDMALE